MEARGLRRIPHSGRGCDPGLFTGRHFQQLKARLVGFYFRGRRWETIDAHCPLSPSGPVDDLVSEGIEQKANATGCAVANPEGPSLRGRAAVGACSRERSHREVIPKERASEVV